MTELRKELMALEAFTFQMEAATDPVELIRTAERTFQCIERIRDAVWNSVAPIPAPVQPSGNTGEFKCATCRDTKQVPFVYGQEYDCVMSTTVPCPDCSAAQPARHSEALSSFTAYCQAHPSERFWQALRNWSRWGYILGAQTRDGGTIDTFNLEGLDGTHATQTATEQPRIWRVIDCNGNGSLLPDKETAHSYASRWSGPEGSKLNPQYSTNNGETWVDEQAEREGK